MGYLRINNDYLMHFGILGQQWGKRNGPPYPLSRQMKNKLQRRDNKDRNAEDDEEDYESRKQRAIKSGSATEVLQFKGDLTNKELNDALNRINMELRLSEISEKELGRGRKKVGLLKRTQSFNSGIDAIYKTGKNARRMYKIIDGALKVAAVV